MYICIYICTFAFISVFLCIKNCKFITSNSISTTHGSTLFSLFCIHNYFLLTVSKLVPIILNIFPYSIIPPHARPLFHKDTLLNSEIPTLHAKPFSSSSIDALFTTLLDRWCLCAKKMVPPPPGREQPHARASCVASGVCRLLFTSLD